MRYLNTFSLLFIISYNSFAQIHISTDQTWSGDTVIVNQNTIVDRFTTLTIASGTVVLFGPSVNLLVEGTLKATGTENQAIIFSGIDSVGWGGIKLSPFSKDSEFIYCKFFFSEQQDGGALHVRGQDVVIRNSIFMFNSSSNGGAIFLGNFARIRSIDFCLIAKNTAQTGGGIYQESGVELESFQQNTITDNVSTNVGGYLSYSSGLRTNFSNNIIWSNIPTDFNEPQASAYLGATYIKYSLIGGTIDNRSVGLVNENPLFSDPLNNDYSLSSDSPAIDTGCYCSIDPDGTRSDMGYKEFIDEQRGLDYIVLDSISARNATLIKQDKPYVVCTNLLIRSGEFLNIEKGVRLIFARRSYVDIHGIVTINGHELDSVLLTAPDTASYNIEGYEGKAYYGWGGARVFAGGELNSDYAIFENLGFTTQIGFTLILGSLRSENGGVSTFNHCNFRFRHALSFSGDAPSIIGENAKITIANSAFKNNIGGYLINVLKGSLEIVNSVFEKNRYGFMINSWQSRVEIRSSTFANNDTRGLIVINSFDNSLWVEKNEFRENFGAVELSNNNLFNTRTYFRNNLYELNKGQLFFSLGSPIVSGNIFTKNEYADPYDYFGNDSPAIVRFQNTNTVFVNNTLVFNSSTGFTLWNSTPIWIANNIFFDNLPSNLNLPIHPDFLNSNGILFQNNLENEPRSGPGNIGGNPRVVFDPQFGIAANSSAIDTGNNLLTENFLLSTDLFENPRINRQIDIGAVEFIGEYVPLTDLIISDTTVDYRTKFNETVATFSTLNTFDPTSLTFTLVAENGLNNEYFVIDGNNLKLAMELAPDTLLRIKVRAEHLSGAWVDEYFNLTVSSAIVSVDQPLHNLSSVYPNPVSDLIRISNSKLGGRFKIYNSIGLLILSGEIHTEGINVSSLEPGVYYIQFESYKTAKGRAEKFIKVD